MVRSGFRVSPAEYETMCQPPNAKSPAATARPKEAKWTGWSGGSDYVMMRRFSQRENQRAQQRDRANFCRGQRYLHGAARLYTKILDKRNKENRRHGQQSHASIAETKKYPA